MVVYGLYIYDRHCTCCFYSSTSSSSSFSQSLNPPNALSSPQPNQYTSSTNRSNPTTTTRIDPGPGTLKDVLRPRSPPTITSDLALDPYHSNDLEEKDRGHHDDDHNLRGREERGRTNPTTPGRLAFDEEAKLVYGVVYSLRNLVSKLSSSTTTLTTRDEPGPPRPRPSTADAFHAFQTSTYKLHSYSSPTSWHLILLTSPSPSSSSSLSLSSSSSSSSSAASALHYPSSSSSTSTSSTVSSSTPGSSSLASAALAAAATTNPLSGDTTVSRQLLKRIYEGPFTEYVVKNPLVVSLDSNVSGRGIGNDKFRREVEKLLETAGV
ncbi:hypothetical protein JCM10212_006708 [Sporobolomyces blumeae]